MQPSPPLMMERVIYPLTLICLHRYTLVLPYDPHLHTTLPMMVIAMAMMYRHRGDNTSSLDSIDKERW